MIPKKTLTLSLKSLRDFAKGQLPGREAPRAGRARRVPDRHRPRHVQSRQAGHPAPVRARGVRRPGRRGVRRVLHLRGDGARRSGHRHERAGDVPRQRSDHRRRHAGAEEDLAVAASPTRASCSPTAPPNRTPAATSASLRTTADPVMRGRQGRRLQDQRQQAVDQQRRHRRCLHRARQHARRPELVRRREGARRGSATTSPRTSTASG